MNTDADKSELNLIAMEAWFEGMAAGLTPEEMRALMQRRVMEAISGLKTVTDPC